MISREDIQRNQEEIGRLALQAVRIDPDGFLEATDAAASPQALCSRSRPQGRHQGGSVGRDDKPPQAFPDDALNRLD